VRGRNHHRSPHHCTTQLVEFQEKESRKTANVHELLQTANAQLSGRYWRAPLDAVGVMALYDKLLQWMAQHALHCRRHLSQVAAERAVCSICATSSRARASPAAFRPTPIRIWSPICIKTLSASCPARFSRARRLVSLPTPPAPATTATDDAAFAAELRALIDAHLPKRNQRLLADVFALCRVISTVYVDETKMTSSNLATCISPNFVTPLEELFSANQSSLLQAYKLFHRVTRVLIDSYDAVFEPAADSFAARDCCARTMCPSRAAAIVASTENNNNDDDDDN
jgi:hypothetical protein